MGSCEAAEQHTVSLQAQERRVGGSAPVRRRARLEVGSWSYSQRQSRSLCVAEGAAKSDLMVFSPNFPPPPGAAAKDTQQEPPSLLDTRQSRSLCVAEGAAKSDLMVFSPNFPPPPGAAAKDTQQEPPALLDTAEESDPSGALVVSSRLDREELCGKSAPCLLRLEVLVERPLRVFHVELEVTDINDNAPIFPAARKNISLSENSPPGSRFPLEGASDADIGANAQLSYTLSPSEHFKIEEGKSNSRSKSLFLVVTKPLDRETIPVHRLLLTASDGGRPSLTGTMELVISVLDVNDNAPQFNQSVYNVVLPEDAIEGTLVVRVNATDLDLGIYGEVIYEIDTVVPPSAADVFSINEKSGEIRLREALDFETVTLYELNVKAKDQGAPPLSGHCSVELEVQDVNDNAPEVLVTSLSVPVPEDASVGTVVAVLSVSDRDSGANGRVRCWVWPSGPFGLEATFSGSYSLVLREALDRDEVGSWSYSQRQSRSLCVAEGAAKSDLMVFSPNFPPPPGAAAKDTQQEPPALLDTL
ncbi:protocadherin alpha-13-like [Empidonax traillii]|uniref:protocadherin alpha-13-like n=1 Tax=Empidonax traillii TaxID=164674 RepID=UPI000FFD08F2|nr:protocadherin alpha-13-like [Empidonax traillii]